MPPVLAWIARSIIAPELRPTQMLPKLFSVGLSLWQSAQLSSPDLAGVANRRAPRSGSAAPAPAQANETSSAAE